MTSHVAVGRTVSSLQATLRRLVVRAQVAIFLAALLLPLSGWGGLDRPREIGGVAVFISDLLVVAAVASAVALRLLSRDRTWPRMLSTPVLGWPLLGFAVLLIPGIVRGHERYGESLVSQPVRLVIYAGIALAMTEISAAQAWRWITAGLYAGAAWEALLAAYYVATGKSQTAIDVLSTGGTRVLSLTTGMFLGTVLVAAIANIDLERSTRRRLVHAFFGLVAAAGIVLSYGRTTFLALAVVFVFLVWTLPEARRIAIRSWRWWVPALVALAAAVAVLAPSTATRVVDRVSANPLTDQSVRWRLAGIHAALAGMKNGEWDTRSGLLTADPTGNHLINASYEFGTTGWEVQGGVIYTAPALNEGFGERSLTLQTDGASTDEGWYSSPVVVKPGQTWLYTTWLEGKVGGEQMNVSIWEYDDYEQAIHRAQLPVVLTPQATQYAVKTTITDPRVTHIRVLVRTRDAEKAIVFGDLATLRQVTAASAMGTREITTYNSDGTLLSPTLLPGGPHIGDNESNYAMTGRNLLINGSFEDLARLGGVQGGTLSPAYAFGRSLGFRSARLTTKGKAGDEGYFSNAVPVLPGQRLSSSVWLEGQRGGEKMLVGIWLYNSHKLATPADNLDFSVNLADAPAQYVVTGVVPPGAARFARVVVRTREFRQQTSVLMDGAELRRQPASPPRLFSTATVGSSYQIDEPLLGLGFGRETQYVWEGTYYRVEGDPDNSYVYLLAGGGILALGGFLFLFGGFVRDAFKRLRRTAGAERALVVWALAAWFIVALNCAMAPFLPRPKIVLSLWAIMLVPALVRQVRKERAD